MVVVTGAAGFLGRLLGAGAQRVGSLIFHKIMRAQKIDLAIKGSQLKNPIIKSAIADFETVIGSYYGELDTKLGNFLDELEKTGLINLIVEYAMFDRKSVALDKSFIELHSRFFEEGEGNAEALLEKLYISFSITIKELSNDRALFELVRICYANISDRFESIDNALYAIRCTNKGRVDSFEDIKPALIKIARGLQSSYKSIRVETTKGARQVEINKIYIPSQLKYRDTTHNAARIEAATKDLLKEERVRVSLSASMRSGDHVYNTIDDYVTNFSYLDFKKQFRRAVILGDPGGGKSTLCQYLCFELSKQASLALQAGPGKDTASQTQKIPLRVILRLYERAKASQAQLTIYDYIIRELKNHVNAEQKDIENAISYILQTGRAVIAFDGLDEILSTAQRREYVDLVSAFCDQFPLCPVMVTSRLVGYDSASLDDSFEELILEKFNNTEVELYVKKFMVSVGGRKEPEAIQLSKNFITQTESNAADLRRNPLMLGLMAWLFEMRRDIPSNRPEIYQECAVLMFERWDPDRDIKPDVPHDFDRLQLFTDIASKLFGTEESAGVDTRWLENAVAEFLNQIYENKARSNSAAKKLVKVITGRAWVMSEVGDGTFAFTHQTFLEYFFARHIDADNDSVEDVYGALYKRIANREWDVVAHLSLQIKTYRNLRRMDSALIKLLEYSETAPDASSKAAFVAFAARALEYLAGSEVNVRNVVEHVFATAIQDAKKRQYDGLRNVLQCVSCSSERKEFVNKCLIDLLRKALFDKDEANSIVVRDIVDRRRDESYPSRHRGSIAMFSIEFSNSFKDTVKDLVIKSAEKTRTLSLIALEWYGHVSDSIIRKYGILHLNAIVIPPYYNYGLFSIIIHATQQISTKDKNQSFVNLLEMISRASINQIPFAKTTLVGSRFTVPIGYWKESLDYHKNNTAAQFGILIIMLVLEEIRANAGDRIEIDENGNAVSRRVPDKHQVPSHIMSLFKSKISTDMPTDYRNLAEKILKARSVFVLDNNNAQD